VDDPLAEDAPHARRPAVCAIAVAPAQEREKRAAREAVIDTFVVADHFVDLSHRRLGDADLGAAGRGLWISKFLFAVSAKKPFRYIGFKFRAEPTS